MEIPHSDYGETGQEQNTLLFQQQCHNQLTKNRINCNSSVFDSSVDKTASQSSGHRFSNEITSDKDQEQCQSMRWLNADVEKLQTNKPKQVAVSDYASLNAIMDEIQKNLSHVKETLTQTSVRCHLSCLRLATLFNPETVETLANCVESCESCKKKIEETFYDDL